MSGTTPDLDVVLADNPSPFTGRGTNTYVLGRGGEVVVVDPGPDDVAHLEAVAQAAGRRGEAAAVVLTHHHVDHSAGARRLAERLGAPLLAIPHPRQPRLDRPLADRDALPGGLLVIATPGHSRDHLCVLWEGVCLFAGDLVAGEGFIVIDPPDGNMTDYLESLRRVHELAPALIFPGHGPAIKDPAPYLEGYIAHRLEREARVLAALDAVRWRRPLSILPRAYDDTPKMMLPIAARSLRAHLDKLVAEGRVEGSRGRYRLRG